MSRPLEGRLVSAVTEFAIEDYGSRQPSLGRVREGCLQAVALGAEAQREPGVTQVAVGQSIGAGAQEKPEHGGGRACMLGGVVIKEEPRLDEGRATSWAWASWRPQGPGPGPGEALCPQGRVLGS